MKNNYYYVIIPKGENKHFLKYLNFLGEFNILWNNQYNKYFKYQYPVNNFWYIKSIMKKENMEHFIGYKVKESINSNGDIDLKPILKNTGV